MNKLLSHLSFVFLASWKRLSGKDKEIFQFDKWIFVRGKLDGHCENLSTNFTRRATDLFSTGSSRFGFRRRFFDIFLQLFDLAVVFLKGKPITAKLLQTLRRKSHIEIEMIPAIY